ncbi:Glycerophosphoryl diester phosphodiesterase family-domain-containing protein [Syncephalis plumigaleata]|nr:Glycerophosphoryl diester phosphodiesterase family-domain-containing protein [Syncephalis plumigaleata]
MKFGKTLIRSQVPEWSRHYLHYKTLKQLIKAASETISKTTTPKIRRAHSPLLSNNPSRQRPTLHRSHSSNALFGKHGEGGQSFESADAAVIAFFYALDRELERVNDFFLYKRTELERRLGILQDKVLRMRETGHGRRISQSSIYYGGSNPDNANDAQQRISGLFLSFGQSPTNTNNGNVSGSEVLSAGEGDDELDSEQAEIDESLIAALLETKDRIQKMMRFVELNLRGFDKILKKFDKNLDRQTRSLYMTTRVKQLPFASSMDFRSMLIMVDRLLHTVEYRVAQRDVATRQRHQRMEMKLIEESTRPTTSTAIITSVPSMGARTVDADDVDTLRDLLTKTKTQIEKEKSAENTERVFYKITTSLLTQACHGTNTKCIGLLIDLGAGALAKDDVNERTLLHKLALHGGRLPENPIDASTRRITSNGAAGAAYFFPCTALSNLVPHRDIRPPLHHLHCSVLPPPQMPTTAASFITDAPDIFGRPSALIHDLHRRHTEGGTRIIDLSADAWCDNEGYTPLFYAVLRGHAETVRVLIDEGGMTNVDVLVDEPGYNTPNLNDKTTMTTTVESLPVASAAAATAGVSGSPIAQYNQHYAHTPLILAARLGYTDVVRVLVERGANVNFCDGDNETSLHQAARYGFTQCASILLKSYELVSTSSTTRKPTPIKLDIGENYNNWTPLFVAAVEGHEGMVQLLLDAGADATLGLLQDCASFTLIRTAINRGATAIPANSEVSTPQLRQDGGIASPDIDGTIESPSDEAAVGRAYGHQFLIDQCELVITLGSSDIRRVIEPVILENTLIPLTSMMPGTSVSLVVQALNAIGEPAILDLPLREEGLEPIIFRCSADADHVQVQFDIVPTYRASEEIIGRATALVSCQAATDYNLVDNKSWQSYTVPIIGAQRLDMLGKVQFETMLVRPFKHANMHINARNTYWKSISTKVIGHRGAGANQAVTGPASLQIGENTVLSFITAASLGAEYIEFDVQLTRDLIPVIYHDWTVTETGLDIPVGKCTLKQFLNIRPRTSPPSSIRNRSEQRTFTTNATATTANSSGSNSSSGNNSDTNIAISHSTSALIDRNDSNPMSSQLARMERSMSLTEIRRANQKAKEAEHRRMMAKSPPSGKIKGNSFGTIQAPFATLQEALTQVPKGTGFNIEVKYPMLDEAEPDRLRPIDLNIFVDRVLDCVYTHAGDRNILFSSFHPDICRLLSRKQPNFPVFFLTDAGVEPMADYRCISVQHAVRFAKSADLLGIVTISDPVVDAPRLVRAIKETGLLLFTYGKRNNDVSAVRIQRQYGVDAVIVDKVMLIRKGLQN